MKVTAPSNMDAVLKSLSNVAKQSNFATMQALNDSAYAVRADLQAGMRASFEGVTPYMVKSIWVQKAEKHSLRATVWPRHNGGSGYDPAGVLAPQVFGGDRKVKAYERALQRMGLMPSGMSAVPGRGIEKDAYGSPTRTALKRILKYFESQPRIAGERLMKKNRSPANYYRRYFVSTGAGKTHHMHPGIWLADGYRLSPMLMFVKMARYSERFKYMDIADASVKRTFATAHQKRMANALRTSK